MARFNNPLAKVRVASPCRVGWDQMIGSERMRFCGQCSLNVYNLSGMKRADAESLIAANEGRLCVRFYRRADGSIITQDCPVGLRAAQRRVAYVTRAIVTALITFLASVGLQTLLATVFPPPQATMGMLAFQGEVAPPPPLETLERAVLPPHVPPKRRTNK